MIVTDGTHLITTEEIETLHKFATSIGLKREWFQDAKHPHYDITSKTMLIKALRKGAHFTTTPKKIINLLKGKKI